MAELSAATFFSAYIINEKRYEPLTTKSPELTFSALLNDDGARREIIRCLKRYVAREVYRMLISCGARLSPIGPLEEAHIVSASSAA